MMAWIPPDCETLRKFGDRAGQFCAVQIACDTTSWNSEDYQETSAFRQQEAF